jgi:hypothetical protein
VDGGKRLVPDTQNEPEMPEDIWLKIPGLEQFPAMGEYTSIIGSVNESLYGHPDGGTFLIANIIRLGWQRSACYSFRS